VTAANGSGGYAVVVRDPGGPWVVTMIVATHELAFTLVRDRVRTDLEARVVPLALTSGQIIAGLVLTELRMADVNRAIDEAGRRQQEIDRFVNEVKNASDTIVRTPGRPKPDTWRWWR
jgi:hypothetical protein